MVAAVNEGRAREEVRRLFRSLFCRRVVSVDFLSFLTRRRPTKPHHRADGSNANRWVMDSDSSDDDEVRVVKSAKDKQSEAYSTEERKLRNAIKVNDWNLIKETFDKLAAAMDKQKKLEAGDTPKFFLRILCDLDDFLTQSLKDKQGFKKLSASNGRSLNRMKLAFRKYIKPFAAEMESFRQNPVVSDEDSDDSDESDSDSESSSSSSSDDDSSDDDSDDDDSDDDSGADKSKPKASAKPVKVSKL